MADSTEKKTGNGTTSPDRAGDAGLLNDVDEGLGQIQEKLSDLRRQILSPFEKVEKLAREQTQFGRRLEKKVLQTRTLASLCLGAAVLALVLSGLVLGVHFYLQRTTVDLQEQMAGMGKALWELRKDMPTADIEAFREALAAADQKVDALKTRVEQLKQTREDRERVLAEAKALEEDRSERMQARLASLDDRVGVLEARLDTLDVRQTAAGPIDASSEWSVNLISFTKERYARGVARSYARRGIPAKVKRVTVGDQPWYRLYVSGFDNPEAAEAYARVAEETLRLNSVWISKN
ncbi:MAG: SPOR domain-containing protein [Deltaproteobacteria bacterium]|nr:SPOR domain-containing protein [Deltaproteobacteria bacterium]MBW2043085.1 SPOR domain-containing protein [Deltaproteobacteria bacterium]MBW2132371.1 SPOR domain-containing protein [Deltaproteobacteria bacterium]